MKKYIPILIIISLFLTSCDDDIIFQKKQECYSYTDDFNKKSEYTAGEIFYSSKMNTCIVKYFSPETHFYFLQDLLTNKIIASTEDPLFCSQTFKDIKERREKCHPDMNEFEKTLKDLK